jgi:hypothetical protein
MAAQPSAASRRAGTCISAPGAERLAANKTGPEGESGDLRLEFSALGQPFPDPETGSTEVRYTADGGALGVGAGSPISGYEIAGIGHGVHMRLVSLTRFGLSRIGLRAGLCGASAVIQRRKCIGSILAIVGSFAMRFT